MLERVAKNLLEETAPVAEAESFVPAWTHNSGRAGASGTEATVGPTFMIDRSSIRHRWPADEECSAPPPPIPPGVAISMHLETSSSPPFILDVL